MRDSTPSVIRSGQERDELVDDRREGSITIAVQLGIVQQLALILVDEIGLLAKLQSADIDNKATLPEELEKLERYIIQSALNKTGGHQTHAAQLLGIKLTTLNMKLKKLGISPRSTGFRGREPVDADKGPSVGQCVDL